MWLIVRASAKPSLHWFELRERDMIVSASYEQEKSVYSSMLVPDMKMMDDPPFHVTCPKMKTNEQYQNCGSAFAIHPATDVRPAL